MQILKSLQNKVLQFYLSTEVELSVNDFKFDMFKDKVKLKAVHSVS